MNFFRLFCSSSFVEGRKLLSGPAGAREPRQSLLVWTNRDNKLRLAKKRLLYDGKNKVATSVTNTTKKLTRHK